MIIPSFDDFISGKAIISESTDKWSGEVKTKKHPKEGVFAEGSAKEISSWCISSHKSLKSAMSALNFYINRAGENLSDERLQVLEQAKKLIQEHFSSDITESSDFTMNESMTYVDYLDKMIEYANRYKQIYKIFPKDALFVPGGIRFTMEIKDEYQKEIKQYEPDLEKLGFKLNKHFISIV